MKPRCTDTPSFDFHRARRGLRAFTLIELLVVVTVIVILIALLAPALDRAVGEAEAVVCASNQRVMSQVFYRYGEDHRRIWVAPWDQGAGDATNNWQWQWPYIIAYYAVPGRLPVGSPPARAPVTGSVFFMNRDAAKMMFCPTQWAAGIYFTPPTLRFTTWSYAATAKYNGVYHVRGYPSPRRMTHPISTLHLSDMALSDETADPADVAGYVPWSFPFRATAYAPGDPHEGRSNYLFVDGRVERRAERDIEDESYWYAMD